MELIIILICLGLERYGQWGTKITQWHWFDRYVAWIKTNAGKKVKISGWQGVAVLILPVLLVVAIIYYSVDTWLYGAVGFVLSLFIFLYCLGNAPLSPVPVAHLEESSRAHHAKHDHSEKISMESIPRILWESNEKLFAVIFWFAISGPIGVLFYRLVSWTREKAETEKGYHSMLDPTAKIEGIMDWLPARFISLGYALMGNFNTTINYWVNHILSGIEANRRILSQCGARAIGMDHVSRKAAELDHDARVLVDRTLVFFIVFIAIFTLLHLL